MQASGVVRIVPALLLALSASAQHKSVDPGDEARIYLRRFLQKLDDDKEARYLGAFSDLDGDGRPEAIVYLMSRNWCGSAGCSMFVLKQNGNSWKTVTKTTISQLPIRVLTNTSHGWRSLSVWVQGGGIRPGYEAELRFDGKAYPRNPSVPPARRLRANTAGEVLISQSQQPSSLYGDE